METLTFEKLDLQEKENLILDNGYYVAKRDEENHKVLLYTFERKYIEMWYRKGTLELQKINILKDQKVFVSYLENIDIKRIFLVNLNGYLLN